MKAPWKGELRIRDRHPEAAIVDLVDERGEPVVLAVNRLVAGAIVERCSSELERAVFQAGFKRGTQEGPRPAVWDSPGAAERFEREYLGTFALETPMGDTSHIEREFMTGRDPGDEGPAPEPPPRGVYPGVECEHGFDVCPTCDGPTLRVRKEAADRFEAENPPPAPDPEPKLYRNRCGWCGSFEGTVDPNEPCPIDEDGEPLGPHQFGVFEPLTGEPATTPEPEEADDVCPF